MSIVLLDKVAEQGSRAFLIPITAENIISKSRKREFMICRRVYINLILKNSDATLETIGEMIGRDHATVIHNRREFENAVGAERELLDKIYNACKFVAIREFRGLEAEESIRAEIMNKRADRAVMIYRKKIKEVMEEESGKVSRLLAAVKRHTSIDAGCPGFIREKLRKEVIEILG